VRGLDDTCLRIESFDRSQDRGKLIRIYGIDFVQDDDVGEFDLISQEIRNRAIVFLISSS
jgi:hypothetical protein